MNNALTFAQMFRPQKPASQVRIPGLTLSGEPIESKDQISYRKRLAAPMIQEGLSTAPVKHWTQGLGRVLTGLSGNMHMDRANAMETARTEDQRAAFEKAASEAKGIDPTSMAIARAAGSPEDGLRYLGQANTASIGRQHQSAMQANSQAHAEKLVRLRDSLDQSNPMNQARLRQIDAQLVQMQAEAPLTHDMKIEQLKKMRRENDPTAGIDERRAYLTAAGIDPQSLEGSRYMLTGKLGSAEKMTPTDRKAIQEADSDTVQYDNAIGQLQRALLINDASGGGYGTETMANIRSGVGLASDANKNALELKNILSRQAIEDMSKSLKGATTDREMFTFIELAGDLTKPPDVRRRFLEAALSRMHKYRELSSRQATEIRGGTYYKPHAQPGTALGAPPPTASPVDPRRMSDDELLRALGTAP